MRSFTRALSASSARVARSSALSLRWSSRARACCNATRLVTNTNPEKPAYSSDCISDSSGEKPSARTNTGITTTWLSSSHGTPTDNGSSQGSTQAATMSSTLPRPLEL